jgi:hypothetical protein
MPLSTQGSCCGHNLNHHTGEGRGRYLRPCLVCTCPAFTPDKEDKMVRLPEGLRRCRAYHPNGLQCEGEATEMTTHIEDHWATVASGNVLRWDDSVAVPKRWVDEQAAVGNGSARLGQVGGEHYRKFKIQPWDVIDEYGLSFYAGNTLKYLLRAGHKGAALEDLKKARHYLDKLIELESGDGQT